MAGPVQHVKIIPDRNYQHGGLNYGFVEYMDMRAAETALQTLNGRKIFDTEIRVNWAYQGQQNKEDTSNHFHVFVGDLSPEVNDEVLAKAFSAFGTLSDARVMWDMNSGKSRGYGFLAFRDKTDAEQAIATMNGEWLGSRAIRVNWANQKTQGGPSSSSPAGRIGGGGGAMMGGAPAPINFQGGPLSYEAVVQQTPQYNTTVYVGNLVPYCTQADLIPLFQSIGYLSEIRMQADRGFAFVKLDTHEHAAMAIVQLQGQMVHGRPIKCSWGKDRADGGAAISPGSMSPTPAAAPYGNMVRVHIFYHAHLVTFFYFVSLCTACRSPTRTVNTASERTVASPTKLERRALRELPPLAWVAQWLPLPLWEWEQAPPPRTPPSLLQALRRANGEVRTRTLTTRTTGAVSVWPTYILCCVDCPLRLLRSTSHAGRSSAPGCLTVQPALNECSCYPWVMFCQSVRVRPCLYTVRSPCTISPLALSPQNFCFIHYPQLSSQRKLFARDEISSHSVFMIQLIAVCCKVIYLVFTPAHSLCASLFDGATSQLLHFI